MNMAKYIADCELFPCGDDCKVCYQKYIDGCD